MSGEKLNSQERIIAEIFAMCGSHIAGMTNKELAEKVETTATNVCRDLAIFEKFGLVSWNAKGHWRLSPKFGGFAGQIAKSYQKAKLLLSEEEARYASAMQ